MAEKNTPAKAKADAKPAKKGEAKKGGFLAGIKRFFARIGKYLKDTRSELKKVVWPSPKEIRNNTVVVVAVVAIAAVFMVVLDLAFGGVIHLLIGV